MHIKSEEYEQIAFVIVKGFLDGVNEIIESGKTPAKFDIQQAIHNYLPEKYLDKNTTSDNYWTKHNEKKLREYINTEITRRKLISALNIVHINDKITKIRMTECIKTLTI